ncbi:C4b-binding protein alpha chain-like [Pantherophis guttatus]|uniref:C4b-binding protein alpha chain-like n=1 Tax=Pantherophis guttatus TaxID=94885 RepID=A0A6P9BJI2_PANGU|nr:C4b-binding protein alpha chain-like [Pantherophis guttatus]
MMALSCNQTGLLAWILLLLSLSEVQSDCPNPVLPPHSSLRTGEVLPHTSPTGTVLRLQCITGHEIIPGTIPRMTCLDTNKWSELPTLCQGKRCPIPHIENGQIVSSDDLRLGEEITLGCHYGFRIIGGATRQCVLKSGRVDWNRELPVCERIPCARPPIIANGRYDPSPSDTYDAGWTVIYRCDADYSLIGNSTITCIVAENGVDGKWNLPSPVCTRKRCPVPLIKNGKILFANDFGLGEKVTLACDYGFRIIGGSTLQCVLKSGKVDWNRELPVCERIPCARPPIIANGRYDPSPSDTYDVGWTVIYRCDADYSLIGQSAITCIVAENGVDGKWNLPSPECKNVKCRRPIIPNGKVASVFQATYTYQNKLLIECDPGYTFVESSLIECDADSQWKPSGPWCDKIMIPVTDPTSALPPNTPEEDKSEDKSLEDRLDIIEKKLDRILHILQLTGQRKTIC